MTTVYDFKNREYDLIGANQQYTELTERKTGYKVKIANQYYSQMFRTNQGFANLEGGENVRTS